MNARTRTVAVVAIVIGALFAGQVFAQANAQTSAQATAPAAKESQPAATTPTHSDPIVQKRMEIRAANQQQRARTAEARQQFNQEAQQARTERNQSAQDSRARAQAALNAE
jgi:hypothetical protein